MSNSTKSALPIPASMLSQVFSGKKQHSPRWAITLIDLCSIIQQLMSDYVRNQPQIFQQLKDNIDRLKMERQQLNGLLSTDRGELNNVEISMAQLGKEVQERMVSVREKERKLMELEKAIAQTEKSYEIIVATTRKLSSALEAESNHLRSLTRK